MRRPLILGIFVLEIIYFNFMHIVFLMFQSLLVRIQLGMDTLQWETLERILHSEMKS